MIKEFLIILLLLCSIKLYSQEYKVLNIYRQQMDLSASTYPRYDFNNKACALIKVILTEQNVAFEGNIVGNVEFKTNEYWVYVTDGTKQLKIKIPNMPPLLVIFDKYLNSIIEAKNTYELYLSKESSKLQMQQLSLKVNPINAKVKIDGFDFPLNDGLITTILPVGTHNIYVESEDKCKTEEIILFASFPKHMTIDLNITHEIDVEADINENQSDEVILFNRAKSYLVKGNDIDAERVALKSISLGYEIGYEILRCLFLLGYYDESPERYREIKSLLNKHIFNDGEGIKNAPPKFA